jgi:hypothetical protein
MQHAVQRQLKKYFNPDVILTSGEVSKTELEKNIELSNIIIKVMGSNRSNIEESVNAVMDSRGSCIVLPEGDVEECNRLFSFSLDCALVMPEMDFIWRLHPNLSFQVLAKNNKIFRKIPSNIKLSKNTLIEDIKNSNWALYRGSTAIIQAAVNGVIPVYLSIKDEISVNTLYNIRALHACVQNVSEFQELIGGYAPENRRQNEVMAFCKQIYSPPNPGALINYAKNGL